MLPRTGQGSARRLTQTFRDRSPLRCAGKYDEHNDRGTAHLNGCRPPREDQIWRLREKYDDLLKEIEDKKRRHARLRNKLTSLGDTVDLDDERFHSAQEMSSTLIDEVSRTPQQQDLLNIVMVGAECAPYSKTGGLADVIGSLPKFLGALGHRVMVVVPRYEAYTSASFTGVRMQYNVFHSSQEVAYYHEFREGVDFVFIDHPSFHNRRKDLYGGSRLDVAFRCALLCKAALEAPWHVPCGSVPYGDSNLVFVANDWHAALLPIYLHAHYQDHGKLEYARSVFVIHNAAHQGRGPLSDLDLFEIPERYNPAFQLYDPVGGEHMNLMKAALICSHRIVAVSHGYAWECQTREGGWGLDAILREQSWKLQGIVNGIDTEIWNPETDVHLQQDGYANYSILSLDGKNACKVALQREMGLKIDSKIPLLGFIGRLDYQKGVDLIRDNFDWLMGEDVQLVLLGTGRSDLEESLQEMEAHSSGKCRSWVGFSVRMAHRITAGCDILLMPSRFEPCGLNQLYALAYGTVPVVHAVGGLRDTVIPFDPFQNTGTGWTFEQAQADSMREAVQHALHTYREFPESFRLLQERGMAQDFSWPQVAQQYATVLQEAKNQW